MSADDIDQVVDTFHADIIELLVKHYGLETVLHKVQEAHDRLNPQYFRPDLPIESLELSTRTLKTLTRAGYTTIRSVTELTDNELLRLPGFGRVSLREIRHYAPWVSP